MLGGWSHFVGLAIHGLLFSDQRMIRLLILQELFVVEQQVSEEQRQK